MKNSPLFRCFFISSAILSGLASVYAQSGIGQILPIESGQELFQDNTKFVFQEIPSELQGKLFIKTSFQSGGNFTAEKDGFLYVITPAEGNHSQADSLKRQGFTPADFFYSSNLWTSLPPNFQLALLEKKVTSGEKIQFSKWGVPVLSSEQIVFAPAPPAAITPAFRSDAWWTDRHAQKLREVKSGEFDLVLLGDSITQRWETDGADVYPSITERFRTLNLGYSGDRTQHVIWRLENGEIEGINPKKLVLLIGTNNLPSGRSTPTETIAGVDTILSKLRSGLPNTQILMFAILPRGVSESDPIMASVRSTNAGLRSLAEKHGCDFLDIGSQFQDPSTGVTRTDLMPDKLHPNADGYRVWLNALESFLSQ